MTPLKAFKELFKRYSWFRALVWVVIIALVLLISALIGHTTKKQPVIRNINPPVGLPGDTLVITGENFGDTRGSSYVEMAGSRLTASGYLAWSDKEIRIVLPSNVQDGLVVVGTSVGRSDPGFFANKAGIPIVIPADPQTTIPVITEITPETASVGQKVTITGSNFGAVRGNSLVFFTASRTSTAAPGSTTQSIVQDSDIQFIPASDIDYDYELWTDTEIHVRVPDGAATGQIYIQTTKGESDSSEIVISSPAGRKNYDVKRTYVVQLSADITSSQDSSTSEAAVTLYLPRPPVSASQPSAELNECYPEPLIRNDMHDLIYQQQLNKISGTKQRFSQNFVISVYEINSNIKEQNISRFQNTSRLLYTTYTAPDNCIPSGSDEIIELRNKILGKEKNPYRQAKLFYNYIIDNYQLLGKVRTGDVSILDTIKTNRGDAYDFAMLFVSLCRSAGIPAVPVSGILASDGASSVTHWWAEIYFENYGWFPVDPALGDGMNFKSFKPIENPKQWYFGNLDSQHIAFSRGWNQIKPSLLNSKTVYRPRTYALQSVWEESSNANANYSSLWSNPTVIGIY